MSKPASTPPTTSQNVPVTAPPASTGLDFSTTRLYLNGLIRRNVM